MTLESYDLYRGRQRNGKLLATFPTEAMANGAVARVRVAEEDDPKGWRGVYTVVRVELSRVEGEIVRRTISRREHTRPRSDVKLAILRLLGACHDNRNPKPAEDVQSPAVQRPDDVWSLRSFLGYERRRPADLPVHAETGSRERRLPH